MCQISSIVSRNTPEERVREISVNEKEGKEGRGFSQSCRRGVKLGNGSDFEKKKLTPSLNVIEGQFRRSQKKRVSWLGRENRRSVWGRKLCAGEKNNGGKTYVEKWFCEN